MKKRFFLMALSLCLSAPVLVTAQEEAKTNNETTPKVKGRHYVAQKPERPTFTKTESPGAEHVYIEDEWKWSSKTNLWEWAGNRWDAIPVAGQKWTNGRWVESPEGWYWQTGYWKGK